MRRFCCCGGMCLCPQLYFVSRCLSRFIEQPVEASPLGLSELFAFFFFRVPRSKIFFCVRVRMMSERSLLLWHFCSFSFYSLYTSVSRLDFPRPRCGCISTRQWWALPNGGHCPFSCLVLATSWRLGIRERERERVWFGHMKRPSTLRNGSVILCEVTNSKDRATTPRF